MMKFCFSIGSSYIRSNSSTLVTKFNQSCLGEIRQFDLWTFNFWITFQIKNPSCGLKTSFEAKFSKLKKSNHILSNFYKIFWKDLSKKSWPTDESCSTECVGPNLFSSKELKVAYNYSWTTLWVQLNEFQSLTFKSVEVIFV